MAEDYESELQEIVRSVDRGVSEDAAAEVVMDRIRGRHIRPDAEGLEQESGYRSSEPWGNLEFRDWAAKQYFKILFRDLRNFGKFREHGARRRSDC